MAESVIGMKGQFNQVTLIGRAVKLTRTIAIDGAPPIETKGWELLLEVARDEFVSDYFDILLDGEQVDKLVDTVNQGDIVLVSGRLENHYGRCYIQMEEFRAEEGREV